MKHIFTVLGLFLSFTLFAQHQFVDVTSQYGIGGQDGLGHAVGWGDINNDGLQDVAFSNQEGTSFWLYKNNGDSFTNITSAAGLTGNSANMILFVDITNDGWEDLVLYPRSGNQKIYINNTDETFSLMTNSGVNKTIRLAADFNNDGWVDLMSTKNDQVTIFYNQNGESFTAEVVGTFTTNFAGLAFDYNQDGRQDIYLGTYDDSPNALFKNNGDGTFTNVASEAGVLYPYASHGLTSGDYNNDGLIDLYIGSYSNSSACKLYQNKGDGTFEDVTSQMGVSGHHDTRTVSSVDYNNDGRMDLFASHHDFYTYSNSLLKNEDAESFTEVGPSMGISGEWLGDYFGLGWADYDNDGDMDLFAAGHIDKYVLWENRDCPGHFVEIILEGVESNFNAVGASVSLWQDGTLQKRWVQVGSGQHDSHSKRLHFGLGESALVDSLKVDWPSGKQLVFNSNQVVVDDIWTIGEDINLNTTDVLSDFDIQIQPNPAKEDIVISSSIDETADIKIFNTQSQLIWSQQAIEFNQRITLPAQLKAGVYFIAIKTSEHQKTMKFIKL